MLVIVLRRICSGVEMSRVVTGIFPDTWFSKCIIIHAHIHTCIHAYIHDPLRHYIHTYIHIHTHIHTYIHT